MRTIAVSLLTVAVLGVPAAGQQPTAAPSPLSDFQAPLQRQFTAERLGRYGYQGPAPPVAPPKSMVHWPVVEPEPKPRQLPPWFGPLGAAIVVVSCGIVCWLLFRLLRKNEPQSDGEASPYVLKWVDDPATTWMADRSRVALDPRRDAGPPPMVPRPSPPRPSEHLLPPVARPLPPPPAPARGVETQGMLPLSFDDEFGSVWLAAHARQAPSPPPPVEALPAPVSPPPAWQAARAALEGERRRGLASVPQPGSDPTSTWLAERSRTTLSDRPPIGPAPIGASSLDPTVSWLAARAKTALDPKRLVSPPPKDAVAPPADPTTSWLTAKLRDVKALRNRQGLPQPPR